ncbi:MAG: NAD(P)H-dependent oxidoreductase [Clostridium sp.]|uniref:flavodoxin family protein n=1 Tax=Clostridium sp. TaxID=1506 RepID=UPI00305A974A
MEITIIHGQGHKGSTYHISEEVINKIKSVDTVINEFFMPRDTPEYCVGCYNCIKKGEGYCPHADKVQPIIKAMERSQIVIIDSPTYCFEMTGQLKTFLDHLAYMWMSHRPNKDMFSKVGIVVSTAAGAGSKRVTKSLAQQLFWLGFSKVYSINQNVNATSWSEVSDKIKEKIRLKVNKIALKIKKNITTSKPNIKTKFMFLAMVGSQNMNNWNMIDKKYWEEKGWLEKSRPWRK